MISLVYLFWTLIIMFSIVGGMRGWGREIVVTCCAILGLLINTVFRRHIPMGANFGATDVSLLGYRAIVLIVSVYFGYEIVHHPYVAARTADPATQRDRLANTLFGAALGAFNGYLLAGSLIFYVVEADYPFPSLIARPTDPLLIQIVNQMLHNMPPSILGEPGVYFAVILAFGLLLAIFSFEERSRA
jgi:hypothetical protein